MAEVYADVVAAMRAYLRADDGMRSLVGNRVFLDVPPNAATPFVIVSDVGGGDVGETTAPIDECVIRFTIRGKREDAMNVRLRLRSLLQALNTTRLDATCVAHGAVVDSVLFSPDPVNDFPQFIVTARVTAIAA